MTKRSYIPIETEDLPEDFEFPIGDEMFILHVEHLEKIDRYLVTIKDLDEQVIVRGEPMTLGERLFDNIPIPELPVVSIIPMDESGQAKELTEDNFQKSVFLVLDDLPDDDGDVDSDDDNTGEGDADGELSV